MIIKIMIGFVALMVVGVIVLVILLMAKPDLFTKNKDKNGKVISSEDVSQKRVSGNPLGGEYIGDTKRFIPVEKYYDYAMSLGNHNYRAIIEVSSVNYVLLSELEQTMVEMSFHSFLNSMNFPFEFYIQTREFDTALMLETLHENISKYSKRFKNIDDYGKEYEANISNVTAYLQNSKIKKKYVIIPFNNTDLKDVSELTNYEIEQFALEELMSRCNIACSGINGIGLSTTILDRGSIAEVLYSYYHRDYYRIARDIIAGEFDSLVINSEKDNVLSDRNKLDIILSDCQNKIKTSLAKAENTDKERAFYQYIYQCLEYFKQDDRDAFIGDLIDRVYDTVRFYDREDELDDYIENNEYKMEYTNYDNPEEVGDEVSVRYPEEPYFGFAKESNKEDNLSISENDNAESNEVQSTEFVQPLDSTQPLDYGQSINYADNASNYSYNYDYSEQTQQQNNNYYQPSFTEFQEPQSSEVISPEGKTGIRFEYQE